MKDYPYLLEKLGRYLSGECSPEEERKIKKWIHTDPEVKKEFEELKATWDSSENFELNPDKDKSWQNISERISKHEESETPIYQLNFSNTEARKKLESNGSLLQKVTHYKWWISTAAVLLVVACTSFLALPDQFRELISSANPVMRQITTQPGERVNVTFSDGTTVRLNAASTIRLPQKFDKDVREVELVRGEAYFNVTTQRDSPFVVHTPKADVEVLGTKFNINAYPKNREIQVVVAEGKVAVRSVDLPSGSVDKKEKEVYLNPGELTIVNDHGDLTEPRHTNLEPHIGWINNVLIFENASLNQVINKLSNYYNISFEVADSSLYQRKLTAEFRNETLTKILDISMFSLDINYDRKGNKIVLKPEKNK